jgi:exodeoxyribonuclease VII small subunit
MAAKKSDISFEDALSQLEEITRKLETGGLSLEDSLKSYEKGMELRKICQGILDQAESRLEYLEKKMNGEVVARPIEPPEEDDGLF